MLSSECSNSLLAPLLLLCPRRVFLASLMLAAKFTHDHSYANSAWSKITGFPVRDLGRCERALGDALGWHLWVRADQVS
ncbi:hypothetical protein C8R46DRAFT_917011 [Mycena filopes]|nr:hypothetical protein C8R46DRAFT_917011 [Mycena filopes]